MLAMLSDYQIWASLLTLTALEIVLGIDNLIFLSIVSGRLPKHQQRLARQIGLALALLGRIALLFSLTWIIGLTEPVLTIAGFALSWRDIVLIGRRRLPDRQGHDGDPSHAGGPGGGAHVGTITFCVGGRPDLVLDIVFALDSIITAVGMTDELPVMSRRW